MSDLTILTIDDDDTIRLSIASFLEDMGFNVIEADCGESGIELIKYEKIDIVLTDTHMPGLSGIDVLKYVQENRKDLPVVIISGAGEIEYAVEALRAGAWDYITKPIENLNFLTYSIDKILKRVNLIKENHEKSLEIEAKNKILNDTIDELKRTQSQLVESEKMASLGYMLNGIAHEINTPLGVCMTSTSYISDQVVEISNLSSDNVMKKSDFVNFTENTKNLTGIIYDSLHSISNLVVNLKQLSVDSSVLKKKKFSLNDAISSIIMFVASSSPSKRVEVSLIGDHVEIESYPEIVNRIIIKLTENAIIHGFKDRDSGKISVVITEGDENIRITFKNNGLSIPHDNIDRIFDPFYTVNKIMGSGLGLYIVYNLITFTLNGTITCENVFDGVVFYITIPKII